MITPETMTPEDRMAEVASILALGFRRHLQNQLEEGSEELALCVTPAKPPAMETRS